MGNCKDCLYWTPPIGEALPGEMGECSEMVCYGENQQAEIEADYAASLHFFCLPTFGCTMFKGKA